MTLAKAKEACEKRLTVTYNGALWKVNGIFTWFEQKGMFRGWKNSLDLIPCNGSNSRTQALVRDCELVDMA